MLKKLASFLSKLNIFCVIVFLVCFIIVRIEILPDNFFDVFLWTGYVSAGVTLFFIISVLLLTFKEKKLQTDFGVVVSLFLDTVFISIVGYLAYILVTTPLF